ncbi:hypothetical protein B0H67DRAFT_651652 [Lasiosphaeris hirsuta]|uniref:Uncharacterized protein n=1 Tax=Lasiosphaeris hirsuta TaxID=260670 RepID=A0AA40B9J5_9PEZI|nr:hypothetical protein B0H67DRAFT_651652 [Lasiosphaeris hirsuta]
MSTRQVCETAIRGISSPLLRANTAPHNLEPADANAVTIEFRFTGSVGTKSAQFEALKYLTQQPKAGMGGVMILYLVDINKSADNVTSRAQAMYEKLGMKKAAIRVRGWPAFKPRDAKKKTEETGSNEAAKTQTRLERASFPEGCIAEKERGSPSHSLDGRAWEQYKSHQSRYQEITSALDRVYSKWRLGRHHEADIERLQKTLVPLYEATMAEADFIVATSAVTQRYLFGC